jgi:uncharacterized protein
MIDSSRAMGPRQTDSAPRPLDHLWVRASSNGGVPLFQRYSHIGSTLSGGPKRYAPLFMRTDDEQVLLDQYANGFWFGMQLTLDTWKPVLADKDISNAVMLILANCTTMMDENERLALIPPAGAQLLADSWKLVPDIIEMLHQTLTASRNIEIR